MDRIILDKYRNKIKQICHNNVRMFDNGNFIIDNVKENEKDSIIRKLKSEPYIDKVDSIAGRYDFSNPVKYVMGGSSRYYDIKGNLKKDLKESFMHTNTLLEAFRKLNEEENINEAEEKIKSLDDRVFEFINGKSHFYQERYNFDYIGDNKVRGQYNILGDNATQRAGFIAEKRRFLDSIGATSVSIFRRDRVILFTVDISKIKEQYEKEKAEAKNKYNAELQTVDIDQYKPTEAILKKLAARRDAGSSENVKAIYRAGNLNKLFTYYYTACILNWKDLQVDIEDVLDWSDQEKYEDLLTAIERRVQADNTKADTRTPDQVKLQNMFRNLANDLIKNNIQFTFKSRGPSHVECEKDARNGRCWTLGYELNIPSINKKIIFCHHTSESVDGGDYGWGYGGYSGNYSKRDIEARIRNDLKSSSIVLEESLNEDVKEVVEYKGFKIEHFPITWKFKDTEFTNDGWIILSPEHFVGGDKDFPLPLRCHDKSPSKTIEFKTLDEAKAWIDKFGNNYKVTIEQGDEIHAWPKEEIK